MCKGVPSSLNQSPFLLSASKNLLNIIPISSEVFLRVGYIFCYLLLVYIILCIFLALGTSTDYNFESLLYCLLLPFLFGGPSSAKCLNVHLT